MKIFQKISLYIYILIGIFMVSSVEEHEHQPEFYDIIIYGATSAGITAAISAAKDGRSVLLISQDQWLGGMTSSGLGATDINRYQAIGGLAREFYRRVYKFYLNEQAWVSEKREDYFEKITKRVFTGKNDSLKMQWVFEPKIARQIFHKMLNETAVQVVFDERLAEEGGVQKERTTIKSIKMKSGVIYRGRVFIDSSYEGDLMAMSGVRYTVGREAKDEYQESYNGILPGKVIGYDGQSIDPYIVKNDPSSGLLPFMESKESFISGAPDHRLQAYCYRFTLTTAPNNKQPIRRPDGYTPAWYEYLARKMELMPNPIMKDFLTLTPMPNRKTDTNHADFVGANYGWPEGDEQTRREIAENHKQYTLGLVWFLANDERVPANIREEMNEYGWPKDEYGTTGHFPHQIYVREARRMVSDYVMTEHNYYGRTVAMDPVGLGTYWLDSHFVSHILDNEGNAYTEGMFWENKSNIYPISYRSIVPKSGECDNLLVPVCLSASHAAYGSIRMEPIYMVLGESAGLAASLAIANNHKVQQIDYARLRDNLLANQQILTVIH